MRNKRLVTGGGIIALVVTVGIWVAADLARISAIKVKPANPPARILGDIDGLLLRLERGDIYDTAQDLPAIEGACRFEDERWDTADFRLPTLIRLLWLHSGRLDEAGRSRIRAALLGFKYWVDQPGRDSMCYWSENHQILFATGEYLAGKLFPDEIFANDGKTGREHMAIARARLMVWLRQRWDYGFVEWYSNTYYVEDAAALACLVDFAGEDHGGIAGDAELAVKSTIVLDLLLYDLASQSWKGAFVSTMGRAYERGKKGGGGDSMRDIAVYAFRGERDRRAAPDRWKFGHGLDLHLILSRRYVVPEVLRAVAADLEPAVIKASTGLALGELRGEGLLGKKTPQMMMLWAMEAFTNPEAISTSVRYAHDQGLFGNEFLHDLSTVDIGLLRETRLLGLVSRLLHPVADGVAIQRASTYTWRTPYFQLASAQRYEAGGFGDQQHAWSATLSQTLSVFTTHPAKPLAAQGALSRSPGYWVGNGRNPDVVQDHNVLLALYVIEGRKGFGEKSLVEFTHAWFPEAAFDQASVEGNRAFGRSGQAYVALLAASPLAWAEGSKEDLLQHGSRTAWVCELGSPDTDLSFEAFKARVSGNPLAFDAVKACLAYRTAGRSYSLTWRGAWLIDGQPVSTEYPRFDSPWVKAGRKPGSITINAGGMSLELNFARGTRAEAPAGP
jgi:hypothetical protein